MSLKYLGDMIDIHGGGQDLIFPHHENEIAQSEGFTGVKPFVKYWLHNGLLQLGVDKMSKSIGNLITIKEALEKYSADALRIFVLGSHYRSPLTYSEEAIEAAKGGAERLSRVLSRDDPTGGVGESVDAEPYRQRFIEAMDDDFNTPQALAALFDLSGAINQAGDSGLGFQDAQEVLLSLGREALGLKLPRTVYLRASLKVSAKLSAKATVIPSAVNARVNRLVEERADCRKKKNWQRADEVRAKLAELGIVLEDTSEGTKIVLKRTPKVEALDKVLSELDIAL